jgi:hypothetical protein
MSATVIPISIVLSAMTVMNACARRCIMVVSGVLNLMPLTKKGQKIKKSMEESYGKKRGEQVFYASKNKGVISEVEKKYAKGGGVRKPDNMPARNKKNFRSTESGAGMTEAGVKAYRRANPGSKLQTAVTEDNPTGKRAARRKSYCARSAGQMKKFPEAAKDPNSRLRQARKRWKC